MKFLKNLAPFLFFTGKGGVGKTSLASSTATKLADEGKKVLLVSTDPASNVAQVFDQSIGAKITAIKAIPNLSAIEVNPEESAKAYRKKIIDPVKDLLPADVVAGIEEQLSGACTTEIAAFDEFTALLTDEHLRTQYDHIIFDTAPTGHTIRMLQLPKAWSSFLEKSPNGTSCLGPLAGLEKQKEQYQAAVVALSDPLLTRMILVSRAQHSALKEVSRTYTELYELGLHNQYLVINGVLPESQTLDDSIAKAIYMREQKAIQEIPQNIQSLPTDYLSLKPFNLVGIENLREFFTETEVIQNNNDNIVTCDVPSLADMVNQLSTQNTGLIMLMGKGGVGKTTMASAIAVKLASLGKDVHLSTSDPAAHLAETFNQDALPNLVISKIDPIVETERYRNEVIQKHGQNLSDEDRAVLEEDLRSPCTEEIAVFQAFSRTIREANKKIVVMDTAPTGHTLLLLDATGAYHNEVIKQMGEKGVTTPMMHIQNQDKTKIILVTLPETTPVTEALHLQEDLRRAKIEPWGWIINNSLVNKKIHSPLLKERAIKEREQINKVTKEYADNVALVGLSENEPVGIDGLLKLTND